MKQSRNCIVPLAAALALTGCYGEQAQDQASASEAVAETPPATPSPTPSPAPAPTVAAPPPPTGTPVAVGPDNTGIRQLASIPSNFDKTGLLQAVPPNSSADPDVVGAFRFLCRPSHLAYDDPIVFPGQKGRAHLHQFFGNTMADANSTYESLRTTGESTCNNMLNRSAYWIPAMMNGRGQVVVPEYFVIYYKRRPASDPSCQTGKGCIALPRGLRYIFGNTMDGADTGANVYFTCDASTRDEKFRTLPEAAAICRVGAKITAKVTAPECWDGVNLDSPDHRSHMANGYGRNGLDFCPDTHPYRIPRFEIGAVYTVDETFDRSGDLSTSRATWHFSSDRMAGMTPQIAGKTFHADWFGAWDDDILKAWTDNCIDKKLSCASGTLGNGTMLREVGPATEYKGPLTVAAPPRPTS